MTRALDPEVVDAIWAAIEPILPVPMTLILWAVTTRGSPTRCAFAGF